MDGSFIDMSLAIERILVLSKKLAKILVTALEKW